MRPFYEREGIVIYHGDCYDILPQIEKSSIHLLLTDPPYGQNFQSNRRQEKLDKITGDDGTLDVSGMIEVAARKLSRGRHAYIFGPDVLLPDGVLTAKVELVWDKMITGTGDLSSPWGLSWEPITFAVQEISAANRAKGYGNLSARIRQGSVLRHYAPLGARSGRHPNEKPVLILRRMIESSTVPGERVLDQFLGSGSTLVAAILEGRLGTGIDVDEGYCTEAAKRVDRALDAMQELDKAVS